MRSKKQHLSTDEVTDIDSAEDVHTELEWRDFYGIVSKAMTRLPVDQRNVFRMSVYGGFSNIEIGYPALHQEMYVFSLAGLA